jgi:hypothetical protein
MGDQAGEGIGGPHVGLDMIWPLGVIMRALTRCVTMSFAAFQAVLQRPCRSVSLGDRWSNNETVTLLESLGAEYDLGLEPGGKPSGPELGYRFTGVWPDYRGVPTRPYQPSCTNYRREQPGPARNIWIIPLSAGKYEGARAFRFWRLKRLARSLGIDRYRNSESQTLKLHIPPDLFRRTLDGLLMVSKAQYLAMVVRSDVCLDGRWRINLERNIEYLHRHAQVRNFRFATPAETIQILT